MNLPANDDTLIIKDGWLICPRCRKQKLLRLEPETEATHLPVWCKHCKTETIVNIKSLSQS